MTPETAARLENLRIQYTLTATGFALFTRGTAAVFARLSVDGVVSLGSTGMMTDNGMAYLLWRGEVAVLAAHGGSEVPATPEQAEEIRRFSADLQLALGLSE